MTHGFAFFTSAKDSERERAHTSRPQLMLCASIKFTIFLQFHFVSFATQYSLPFRKFQPLHFDIHIIVILCLTSFVRLTTRLSFFGDFFFNFQRELLCFILDFTNFTRFRHFTLDGLPGFHRSMLCDPLCITRRCD
jgi:hypothetical protein